VERRSCRGSFSRRDGDEHEEVARGGRTLGSLNCLLCDDVSANGSEGKGKIITSLHLAAVGWLVGWFFGWMIGSPS
jgi:hypothetical protein